MGPVYKHTEEFQVKASVMPENHCIDRVERNAEATAESVQYQA